MNEPAKHDSLTKEDQKLLVGTLSDAAKVSASDVHFGQDQLPWIRRGATFEPVEDVVQPEGFVARLHASVKSVGGMDSAMLSLGGSRWRCTAFDSVGGDRVAFRRIPETPPPLQQLGVVDGEELSQLAQRRDGLVLVVGGTGSGKTTTVASLLDVVNQTRAVNILTIEDPVEYVFTPQRARITQRSVISADLNDALETALRSDMDVVVLGECRTDDQIKMCLRLAATGHLVFSTLHARNTTTALSLLTGEGSPSENIKASQSIAAVIAQQLLPHRDNPQKRVLAAEVLIANNATKQQLSKGNMQQINTNLKSARATMDHRLKQLVASGHLDADVAKAACIDPAEYDEI